MDVLILPDNAAGSRIAETASAGAPVRTITHSSGRPWLLGQWRDDEALLVSTGTRRLVVFGRTRIDETAARRALTDAKSTGDLDSLARTVSGCGHLLASIDGVTRSQGSLSTARQVFFADVSGVTVAALDAAPITQLIGAVPDDGALAMRLLSPATPWPLCLRTIWRGVEQLPAGAWLRIEPDGGRRVVPWWRPPEPAVPLDTAAGTLRGALTAALTARVHGGSTLSADLSGGLDSTSLCFLADAAGADLVTQHWQPIDRANEDTTWAQRAARLLPGARHRFVDPAAGPTWFDAEQQPATRWDPEGPLTWARNRAHLEHQSRLLAAEGIRLHLVGVGGDELFGLQSAYLWSLFRRHPLRSIPTVRRAQLVNRWRLRSTARGLLDRTTFARSLAIMADGIANPGPPRPGTAPQRWGSDPRMPRWATREAVDRVCRLLREQAAAGVAPLDPDRLQHQILQSVIRSGVAIRQLNSAMAHFGVSWEAPFLDDQVVDAALSVRVEDRVVRGRYKPVLTTALQGVVPRPILDRRDKGEFSAEVYRGLRRNLRQLLELSHDLRLAEIGLVDPAVLRAELGRPHPDPRDLRLLEGTLSLETWLRCSSAPSRPDVPTPTST